MKKFKYTNKAEDFINTYKLYASGEVSIQGEGMSKGKWISQDEIRLTPNQVREVSIIYKKHLELREGEKEKTWKEKLRGLTKALKR